MKRIAAPLFLRFSTFHLLAQNLLINPGFEEENICLEYEKNCAPEGWISTSLYANYYFDDKPNAHQGNHFTGLILARKDKPQLRNFLRSRLLCKLRPGTGYKLQFYIRSRHRIFDSIGIFFSTADLLYEKDRLRASRPQLFIASDSSLQVKDEWQKVSLVYHATGNENFINIGDFNPKGHSFGSALADINQSYYFFLDDISLTPLNPAEKLCDGAEKIREEEYDFNARHDKLDRLIYYYTKQPPEITPLTQTVVQRVDTLVIPDALFATASYALTPAANIVLDSFLRQSSRLQLDSLVIEGHTDSRGNLSANQTLSENRAASVAAYLQKSSSAHVATRGWASLKPVADNRTADGRQRNRRVEIYIYVRE